MTNEMTRHLSSIGLAAVKELETDTGILASGREEIFGCIFGRDSLITDMKLIRAYQYNGDAHLLSVVKKSLENLFLLQGKEVNIESGEEPGKCIHEYRPENHEHLTKWHNPPWYVYPDGKMRIYDTVDGTPLLLMATYRYWKASGDQEFLENALPHVRAALRWVLDYGDSNGDQFIDYQFSPERVHGGLHVQSWMDSDESLFHEDGSETPYPIAPVEVQAYAYMALRMWSDFFAHEKKESDFAKELSERAATLKKAFNEKFVLESENFSIANGIDGVGKPLEAARSSQGHVLWASWKFDGSEQPDTILDEKYIPFLVKRLMQNDLFEPEAGIRTLSKDSSQFEANSYHNGSIWPHDTGMIAEGLDRFGYEKEAEQVREALAKALLHFDTPLELFVYDEGYQEYRSATGQGACRLQAWSAATLAAEMPLLESFDPQQEIGSESVQ